MYGTRKQFQGESKQRAGRSRLLPRNWPHISIVKYKYNIYKIVKTIDGKIFVL